MHTAQRTSTGRGSTWWGCFVAAAVSCFPAAGIAACTPAATEVGGDIPLRLPFRGGEQYLVTQGYCKGGWDHSGYQVDFAIPEGTPVVACSAGRVVQLGTYSGTCTDVDPACELDRFEKGGLFVKLQHPCSESGYAWYSSYLHLNSQSVTNGQQVQAGQIVGLSGNTGWSTGPHLHFHIRKGPANNPLNDPENHVGVRPTPMAGVEIETGLSPIVNFTNEFSYRALEPFDAITNVMSPIVSYQFPDDFDSEALRNGGILSLIVSYQFPDDFTSQALSNGGVLSPMVSYVYCEWPGNQNVSLQTSPVVSYFYQSGAAAGLTAFQGRVVDTQGRPLEHAVVEARVMDSLAATAVTGPDGGYVLPPLPVGTYALSAAMPGWVADRRAVALSAATARQDFQLRPMPSPPPTTVANSTPAFIPPPDGAQGSALRVFDGTGFVPNLALLDRSKMSVVLTHGWNPSFQSEPLPLVGGWPSALATTFAAMGVSPHANIVAWDWLAAATSWSPPEEATPQQGIALGEALQQALGADYRQKVHFIGHSLGTLINGYAVDYLHGYTRAGHRVAEQPWAFSNTHVTMSDEGAIARLIAKETLADLVLRDWRSYATSVALGWKNPVPHDFLWLDNYISSVGRYHPEAVNVLLQKGMLLALADHSWFDAAVQAHSYPVEHWYPRTVASATRILPGFAASFEYKALHPSVDFPPTGPEFVPGIAFRQSEAAGDELALELVMDLDLRLYYPAVTVVGVAGAEGIAEGLADWAETQLDRVAAAGRRFGDVLVEVRQDVGVSLDQAVDRVVNGAGTVWDGVLDLLNQPSLRIKLQTGLPPTGRGVRPAGGGGATNTPAAIWLPVTLPANVSMLAFDFVMEGDGKEDALVFGVGDTNLFTLAAKFIPASVTNTSRAVDVSAWAGTTNELFFGILGGSSTNCIVRVERVRLLALAPPDLAIASDTDGTIALSWPSTASSAVLETAVSLNGSPWDAVTNTPALFGGRFTVMSQWADRTRFFRLRRP